MFSSGWPSRNESILYHLKIRSKTEIYMTYDPISQNNDDHFYTAVCAYVRGERNGIVPGTVGEEQAEIAKLPREAAEADERRNRRTGQ
jgi:hypothetical protein